jgi:hypothetical protein
VPYLVIFHETGVAIFYRQAILNGFRPDVYTLVQSCTLRIDTWNHYSTYLIIMISDSPILARLCCLRIQVAMPARTVNVSSEVEKIFFIWNNGSSKSKSKYCFDLFDNDLMIIR